MPSTVKRIVSSSPPSGKQARKRSFWISRAKSEPLLPRFAAERELFARSRHPVLPEIVIFDKFQNFSLAQVLL
jgi:hypothetical protein